MNSSFISRFAVALLSLAIVGKACAEGKPYTEGRFQGRIAYSADGNHNDPDDWAASPVALAIMAGAGVKDRLVHFDYNCILPQTDPAWEKTHADSVLGAAERYGFDRSRFFDCRRQLDAAIGSIARAINDSSAENPLYFIIAGPMEVPYRGIEKSDPARRQFVYCVSHSRWNDGFASKYKFTFSKRSVIEQDVHWVQIADQNRLLSYGRYGRPSLPEEFKPYFWMRDARDPNVRFLWERMVVSTRPDPSDAGMAWFLVTGDEECDPAKLKRLLDDRQPLPPVTARKQVRIEAENFRHFEGFVLEDRNDRQASHRLNVKLAGASAGRIRTPFDEPFTRDAGRYDVDIRCLGEPAGPARFRFLVNGTAAGQEWQATNAGGQWATHTLADLAIKRGDDLTVEARTEGQGIVRLDYVQLRSTGNSAAGLKFERHRLDLLEGDYFGCAVARLGAGQGPDFVLGGARGVKQLLWYEHPDWKKHVIAEGVYTYSVGCAMTDVDADGRPDLIITEDSPQPGLVWYRCPQDPRAGKWDRFAIKMGDWVHDLVLTEMKRADGRRARGIVTEWKRRVLTWFEIPGDPTQPWPEVALHSLGGMFEGTAVGDLAGHGRADIVCAGAWFEAPPDAPQGEWKRHPFSPYRNYCRAATGDFNGDGRPDIVLVESEYADGRLAWYEAPANPAGGEWKEHRLNDGDLYFSHTLGVADFDRDGRLDILAGEMGQGGFRAAPPPHAPRLIVYRNDGQGRFTPHIIGQESGVGIHDGIVADINGDGKPDIIGKNAIYRQESPPHQINPTNVDWWENRN